MIEKFTKNNHTDLLATKNLEDKNIDYYKKAELYIEADESDLLMQAARQAAVDHSLTYSFPIGIIIVKDSKIISTSGNGNGYHEQNVDTPGHKGGCKRRYISGQLAKEGNEKLKSGEGFELCDGCDTDFHAEARAIKEALVSKGELEGADVYMYGHWWCCKDCWDKMNTVGIKNVHVLNKFRDKNELIKWRDEFQKLKSK